MKNNYELKYISKPSSPKKAVDTLILEVKASCAIEAITEGNVQQRKIQPEQSMDVGALKMIFRSTDKTYYNQGGSISDILHSQ